MPASVPRPRLVLVVDDSAHHRWSFSAVLERAGYQVAQARDGEEALAQARARLPDLVLLDLSMPVVDGWETIRRLRADPAARDVPVIACTAEHGVDDFSLRLAGFNGLLRKPFLPAQLRRAVADSLGAAGWVSLAQHSVA